MNTLKTIISNYKVITSIVLGTLGGLIGELLPDETKAEIQTFIMKYSTFSYGNLLLVWLIIVVVLTILFSMEAVKKEKNEEEKRLKFPFLCTPRSSFTRFLFRAFAWLDRRKGYFLPLHTRSDFSKENLEMQFLPTNYLSPQIYYFLPPLYEEEKSQIEVDSAYYRELTKIFLKRITLGNQLNIEKVEKVLGTYQDLDKLFEDVFFHKDSHDKKFSVQILAEAGTGKTTFLQKCYLQYAKQYPKRSIAFVYAGKDTLKKLKEIPNPENTILFLDALDEDVQYRKEHHEQEQQTNPKKSEERENNKGEASEKEKKEEPEKLVDFLKNFHQVFYSCRLEFFRRKEDELAPKPAMNSGDGGHKLSYRILLKEYEPEKVKAFLALKYKEHKEKAKILQVFTKNQSFFCRPLLFSYPELLLETKTPFLNNLQIYETIVSEVAKRQIPSEERIKAEDTDYPKKLKKFSRLAAKQLFTDQKTRFTWEEICTLSAELKDFQCPLLAAHDRSFLTRIRETDTFAFTHSTFYDYFLAMNLFHFEVREEAYFESKNRYKSDAVAEFYNQMCLKYWAKKEDNKLNLRELTQFPYALIQNSVLRAAMMRKESEISNDNVIDATSCLHWLEKQNWEEKKLKLNEHYLFKEKEDWEAWLAASIQERQAVKFNLTPLQRLLLHEHIYDEIFWESFEDKEEANKESICFALTEGKYTELLAPLKPLLPKTNEQDFLQV
ncbi:MAG: NACHT domain-containing protein, partial [Bacteroidia bacterium]